MDDLFRDVRLALRRLLKAPGFTSVATATLAMGIGANTAVFSVVNQGLAGWSAAYERPDELVMVWQAKDGEQWLTTPFDFRDWKEQATSFARLSAYFYGTVSIAGPAETERAAAAQVSVDLFDTLGVRPLIGRGFAAGEDLWGSHRVVVLAHGFWRRALGGDAAVVGREIRVNGDPHRVVGVMPPGAWFSASPVDLWQPLAFAPGDPRNHRNSHFVSTVARLAPGTSLEQARAEMQAIARRLERHPENRGVGATVTSLRDEVLGDVRPVLLLLMSAVALVLMVACANVANLLLARAASARREIAVRLALGAGRRRVVRQFLTESLLLAVAAGSAGVLLAAWATDAAALLVPEALPRLHETGVRIDGRALAFTIGVSLACGVVFGLVPAWQASSANLTDSLAEGGRGGGQGRRAARARQVFVISEMGLAVLLLAGAGLLVRSFMLLQQVDAGVREANVLTVRIGLPWSRSIDDAYVHSFFPRLIQRVEALPGVEMAGVSSHRPLGGGGMGRHIAVEGRPPAVSLAEVARVSARQESARSLQALGVTVLRGRLFGERDDQRAARVAIINQELARRMFPGQDPIGQRVVLEAPEHLVDPQALPPGGWARWTIVGVVENVRYGSLAEAPEAVVYVPYLQRTPAMPWSPGYLLVRTKGDPAALVPAIRREVAAVDPDQAAGDAMSWDDLRAASLGGARFNAAVMTAFGATALLLALLGVFGIMSYSVKLRRREIGVRLALGARGRDVVRLVVGQGLRLALFGLALGLTGALALGRVLSGLLFGVRPTDPVTLLAVAALLAAAAIAASYLPARLASRLSPAAVLREE
jgi:putative ABC transport system permease protein